MTSAKAPVPGEARVGGEQQNVRIRFLAEAPAVSDAIQELQENQHIDKSTGNGFLAEGAELAEVMY